MAGKLRKRVARSAAKAGRAPPSTRAAGEASGVPATTLARVSCPVVAIGASAGGLEAITQLLAALPPAPGSAFVLVQHLAPTRPSLFCEIIARATAMPVMEVHDESPIAPDHVYVIPPNCNLIVSGGILKLLPREASRGMQRPIDLFFRSLAEDQGDRSIGVVLSGTASDGTAGLEEIKAAGGITFAQDDTAQHVSMPRSAVAAGCVDFVMAPAEIAREIAHLVRQPQAFAASAAVTARTAEEPEFQKILRILRDTTGVDFAHYKTNTIHRRILRRVVLRKVEGLDDYVQLLLDDPAEVSALHRDILINVTSFFRNPECFEALRSRIFSKLDRMRPRAEAVRAWVLGCSTGEEAYSLAMLYSEFAAATDGKRPLQIFASDLNEAAIEKARAGIYPKTISDDVSPKRLQRFFTEIDGNYQVIRSIREMCVFAHHNALNDPPFSRIDLVSCRNLLIYLAPVLQDKLLQLLHYALKPGGFLLVGSSESVASQRALFEVADAKHRIFSKKPGLAQLHINPLVQSRPATGADRPPDTMRPHEAPPAIDAQKAADRVLLAKYAPPGVLVNSDLEILQFHGDTGPYLTPPPGKATLNLLKMAREGLLVGLRAAIQRASRHDAPVRTEGLRVKSNGGYRDVNLHVLPVPGNDKRPRCYLVMFEAATGPSAAPPRPSQPKTKPPADGAGRKGDSPARHVTRLTQELAATREYLQSVIEQQESANEELQSANEEVQSANEELQSINEELETSKEEIQSSNEELNTVNDELQNRNLELGRINNDLVNLLASAQMPIVMLTDDLRIRRFTPLAEKQLSLLPTDVGRRISDIRVSLDVPHLDKLIAQVIDTANVLELETQDPRGRWFSLRIRPYRTLDNKIDGAVMILVDVDAIKRLQEYAESIVNTAHEPLLILDAELRVNTSNQAFYETFQVAPQQTLNRLLFEIGNGQWNIPTLHALLGEVLSKDHAIKDYLVVHEFERIGQRSMLLNARKLLQADDRGPLILLAIHDVTQHVQAETALRTRADDLITADLKKNQFLAMLAHELRNPLAVVHNGVRILKTAGAARAARARAQDMIERQVETMAQMIDDMLDVHRIARETIELRKRAIDVAVVLRRAVELCQPQIESRGQKLILSLPPDPIPFDADPLRLEQVFSNLLDNASKFSGRGDRIWLSAERATREGPLTDEIVVRLRDEGAGMAPEALPHVFDLFVQADQTLDRSRGGLGIGLTMARGLIVLHGGTLEAHSAGLGTGSEFVARLPIARRDDVKPPRRKQSNARAAGQRRRRARPATPRRILVVDDNALVADSLAELLRTAGHEVQIAYDGMAGLEAAASFEPDMALLDIGLPSMDGYEVARQLRRQAGTARSILLVAVSGYGHDEYRRRSQEAGFDAHLVKPIDLQELQDLLARHAKRKSRPRAR